MIAEGIPTKEQIQKLAKAEAGKDLEKKAEELLVEIHDHALHSISPDDKAVTATVAKFASLLTLLSIQAEKGQKIIRILTWVIAGLTLVLVVLTCFLIFHP